MSMIFCRGCGKEIHETAVTCPHCGAPQFNASADPVKKNDKARKPMWVKVSIVILAYLVFAIGKSSYESYKLNHPGASASTAQSDKFAELFAATPSHLSPTGELSDMFNLMSENTDLQRKNKFKEIKGKVVEWTLPVYEVKQDGSGYVIQTVAFPNVGAFVYVTARNEQDKSIIEGLKTGSRISFKGVIEDVTMRHLEINPAILFQPGSAKPVAIEVQQPAQVSSSPTNILALVGEHPERALDDPALTENFRKILGEKLDGFRERLSVSPPISQEGEWLVGQGGMQHLLSIEEAAFAISAKTGEPFAIMLTDGKNFSWFGATDVTNLPAPLQSWYKDHGGN